MLHQNALTLGYYRVGNKVFNQKVPALIYATETKQQPTWVFHDEVFDAYAWELEPAESLAELYRKRAQQLRDKYSYLVLSYSGGSDSQNVLMTFINNNIKLDEVHVFWPVSASEKTGPNSQDLSVDNITSEWGLTVKPRLQWLAANHPEIKITVNNWSANLHKVEISEDFLLNRNHNFSIYGEYRARNDRLFDAVAGRRGAVIHGIDKPMVCIHNNEYKIMFSDNFVHPGFTEFKDVNHNVELFYWSPDSCDMMAKQAHEVIRLFEASPQYHRFITWPMRIPGARQIYESSVRPVIYPTINTTVFQVDKVPNMNFGYDVIVKGTELETEFNRVYQRGWDLIKQAVNPDFCTVLGGQYTISSIFSCMRTIKKRHQVLPTSIM